MPGAAGRSRWSLPPQAAGQKDQRAQARAVKIPAREGLHQPAETAGARRIRGERAAGTWRPLSSGRLTCPRPLPILFFAVSCLVLKHSLLSIGGSGRAFRSRQSGHAVWSGLRSAFCRLKPALSMCFPGAPVANHIPGCDSTLLNRKETRIQNPRSCTATICVLSHPSRILLQLRGHEPRRICQRKVAKFF